MTNFQTHSTSSLNSIESRNGIGRHKPTWQSVTDVVYDAIVVPVDDVMTTTRFRINDVMLYVIVCIMTTLAELMSPAYAINWL